MSRQCREDRGCEVCRGTRPDPQSERKIARNTGSSTFWGLSQELFDLSLALRETGAVGPELVARLQVNYRHVIDGLAAYIEAAIERQLYRPVHPQLVGWVIVGMLERAVHYAVLVEDQADLDQLADDLVRLELGGLLVDEWEEVLAKRGEQH